MDALKNNLEILNYIYSHNEEATQDDLIQKFGKENWRKFAKWAISTDSSTKTDAYAKEAGGKLMLTIFGMRKIDDLRKVIAEEKRSDWIMKATIVMAIFAVLGFITAILGLILEYCK